MKTLTLEEHRKRIENINRAEINNRSYFRRHRVHDYMPGQVTYNLGDYPAPFSIAPTDYDYNMLKTMAENGVELIQIHEEWNDPVRHLGADKYTSHDPEGLQKFVDLCHYFGMKIIPYISSGYFHEFDPDFKEEFSIRKRHCTVGMHFSYRTCSAGSAEWRDYLLPRTFAALDKYGFDGIFNDQGMDSQWRKDKTLKKDGLPYYDPEMEDILSLIYGEVKKRGGVYKLHCDLTHRPPCTDKVYDYLWIGECIQNPEIGVGKDYPEYVVPCPDYRFNVEGSYESQFAKTIPFMQFPLLPWGRPLLGKRIKEDIPYYGDQGSGSEYDYNRLIGEYMKEHPNGPYVHSLWSSIPDNESIPSIYYEYLALYKPMVEESSVVYIELRDCADILSQIPSDVYISMFVNENRYLVASNFTDEDYTLQLSDVWTDRRTNASGNQFVIKPRTILFLVQ
jgi:hypothetical protein